MSILAQILACLVAVLGIAAAYFRGEAKKAKADVSAARLNAAIDHANAVGAKKTADAIVEADNQAAKDKAAADAAIAEGRRDYFEK